MREFEQIVFGTIFDWRVWKRLVLFMCWYVAEEGESLLDVSWNEEVNLVGLIIPS